MNKKKILWYRRRRHRNPEIISCFSLFLVYLLFVCLFIMKFSIPHVFIHLIYICLFVFSLLLFLFCWVFLFDYFIINYLFFTAKCLFCFRYIYYHFYEKKTKLSSLPLNPRMILNIQNNNNTRISKTKQNSSFHIWINHKTIYTQQCSYRIWTSSSSSFHSNPFQHCSVQMKWKQKIF